MMHEGAQICTVPERAIPLEWEGGICLQMFAVQIHEASRKVKTSRHQWLLMTVNERKQLSLARGNTCARATESRQGVFLIKASAAQPDAHLFLNKNDDECFLTVF